MHGFLSHLRSACVAFALIAWLVPPAFGVGPESGAGSAQASREETPEGRTAGRYPISGPLAAEDGREAPPPAADAYRTPLAGEPFRTALWGRTVEIEARDRGNLLALSLGATFFTPPLGDTVALPYAALYGRRTAETWRARAVIAVFDNDVDLALRFGRFELIGRLESYTIPFPTAEFIGGETVEETSIEWGSAGGSIGGGLRIPVHPLQADNDLRIQLFYHASGLYTSRTSETGPDVMLPPDTLVHGLRLRLRYDGLRRNLLELLHRGIACGLDLELARRDHWADSSFGGYVFEAGDTRDYLKVSGYAALATGLPWLSERHVLVLLVHAGWAAPDNLDRFSAFRIGGGPFPTETDDLDRHPYPGALFNQFPVSDYVLATLEYRFEALFFLYLHARITFAWGRRPLIEPGGRLNWGRDHGEAFSAAVTSGFFLNSLICLEYAYDTSAIRGGDPGSSLLLTWSKSF